VSLRGRLLQLRSVMAEAIFLGVAIVVAAAAFGFARWLPYPGETRVSVVGMVLQLLGLGTVVIGLDRDLRQLGRPAVRQQVAAWFQRLLLVFAPSKSVTVEVGGLPSGVVMAGGAHVEQTPAPGASLERRVLLLEGQLTMLKTQVAQNADDCRVRSARLDAQLEREVHQRLQGDRQAVRMIKDLTLGGLRLQLIGLVWLACGIVGTSIPQHVARWLGWL